MNVSELATRVLFGTRLEDKLFDGGLLQDEASQGPIAIPDQPGRPAGLALDSWHGRERTRFGDVRGFHSEKERGLVLHFFANHELLALELMALALLKFPEAPTPFREGLTATLRDEQMHLSLYVERMEEIGVEFGEIPVSDFFWRAISTMETPVDFVTRLSLTLEQANLDYAPYYHRVYEDLGDSETAAIMSRVYEDEINHVRYGLNWFETWRDRDETLWSSYEKALQAPLNPGRAKGIGGFNKEGRREAGLDEEFISKLEIFSHSRGRCPDVFWFNPACDSYAGHGGIGFTPSKPVRQLAADFATLPLFLCAGREDVVIVPRQPETSFLQKLQSAGFDLPEFVESNLQDGFPATSLLDRRLQRLRPWGQAPDSARFLAPLVAQAADRSQKMTDAAWQQRQRIFYSKAWSATQLRRFLEECGGDEDWLCDTSVAGAPCATMEAVNEAAAAAFGHGAEEVVVKGAFGSAGRDQVHFQKGSPGGGSAEKEDGKKVAWIARLFNDYGCVVVEPWLNRVVDLSAQYEIDPSGDIRLLGTTRFLTDNRGQYRGSFVHQKVAGLDEATRRFLYGDGRDGHRLHRLYERFGQFMVSETEMGRDYVGPVGVDGLVYRDGDGELRLKPVVEVNPKFTMGRIALNLAREVNAARTAMWLVIATSELRRAGVDGGSDFAEKLEEAHPIELTADGQISRGGLFTTDPREAEAFVSLLVVAETLQGCREILGPMGHLLPPPADA